MSDPPSRTPNDESAYRRPFETEGVYSAQTICRKANAETRDYVDELLSDRLNIVRAHLTPGVLLDLCCATGDHLLSLRDIAEEALGIDFSQSYIAKARSDAAEKNAGNIAFVVGNAKALPLGSQSIGTLYSFSSLYTIRDVSPVFTEIARVLKPGGCAILDLQNSRSLNAFCVRKYYQHFAPTFPISLSRMFSLISKNELRVIEHRSFQILPLWAGRPLWLWPLLHPFWKVIMKHRFRGRMIDEWVSSAWPFKLFAYRHVMVLKKK